MHCFFLGSLGGRISPSDPKESVALLLCHPVFILCHPRPRSSRARPAAEAGPGAPGDQIARSTTIATNSSAR